MTDGISDPSLMGTLGVMPNATYTSYIRLNSVKRVGKCPHNDASMPMAKKSVIVTNMFATLTMNIVHAYML